MAHAQKPDFVFRRNGRVHLNRPGRQFSRILAAEVYASAVVMRDTPCTEVVWRVLATHFIRQFPLHFPSRASPCAIAFQLDSIQTPKRMAPHFRRQLPTQDLFTKCNFCSTNTGPHSIGQICVETGSLIPIQNFWDCVSSLDWHRLLRLLDCFLVSTHIRHSCARGKFEYTGLIFRYEILPTMKLIWFHSFHEAPVEHMTRVAYVTVTVTAKGKPSGLQYTREELTELTCGGLLITLFFCTVGLSGNTKIEEEIFI